MAENLYPLFFWFLPFVTTHSKPDKRVRKEVKITAKSEVANAKLKTGRN